MQSRLREQTQYLMKALEGFYPFVKNAEEQISLLEGDVAQLMEKRKNLSAEISEAIEKSDMLLAMDKKKTKEKLETAELLLEQAQALYLELYRAQVTKIVPPVAYADSVMAKAKDTHEKIKKEKASV